MKHFVGPGPGREEPDEEIDVSWFSLTSFFRRLLASCWALACSSFRFREATEPERLPLSEPGPAGPRSLRSREAGDEESSGSLSESELLLSDEDDSDSALRF